MIRKNAILAAIAVTGIAGLSSNAAHATPYPPTEEALGWSTGATPLSISSNSINWTTNGGNDPSISKNTNLAPNIQVTGAALTMTSNSGASAGDTGTLTGTIELKNTATSGGNSSIVIYLYDPTWQYPSSNVVAFDALNGTSLTYVSGDVFSVDASVSGTDLGAISQTGVTAADAGSYTTSGDTWSANGTHVPVPTITNPYAVLVEISVTLAPGGKIEINPDINVDGSVPEPVSLALLASGLMGLGWVRKRRAA